MSGRCGMSIDMTKIMTAYKSKHSAFTTGKNGHIYLNATLWMNDEEDQYHKNAKLNLNSAKDKKDEDRAKLEKFGDIVGNGVWSMGLEGGTPAGGDNALDDFGGGGASPAPSGPADAIDDLPF